MEEQSSKKQAIVTIAVVAITIFLVLGVLSFAKKKSHKNLATTTDTTTPATTTQTNNTPSTTQQDTSTTTAPATTTTSAFKDGTYKAVGTYNSPDGNESITISVTLKDGVVTDTSATSGASDRTAAQYQSDFISGYKSQVVGKKVGSVSLSRVSGSSLTSQGFNNALAQIKQQAQA